MKKNRKMIKGVSLILLIITIAPLLMELEENLIGITLITAGTLGIIWALASLYEDLRWGL